MFLIEPETREDDRGFFARWWCRQEFTAHGLDTRIAQANVALNTQKGTLRGLHYQLPPREEVKLVRCTMGSMFDVALDLRPDSPTYLRWVGAELSADNRRMLYIPAGCAHGYQTLEHNSEMFYLTSDFYAPELARGVRYDDPAFGITWPLPVTRISAADRSWPDYSKAVPVQEQT